MPPPKPVDIIQGDIIKLKKDILEIKDILEYIKKYINDMEETRKQGWLW